MAEIVSGGRPVPGAAYPNPFFSLAGVRRSKETTSIPAAHGQLIAKLVCTSCVRGVTRLMTEEVVPRPHFHKSGRRLNATKYRSDGKVVTWHASWGSLERFHNGHYANLNPILTH